MVSNYPIDLRADYPERSSRGWAALTILLIKLIALVPHGIILLFLGIAQAFVALVAQVVVAVKGEYPEGMFTFVTGVLRWNTRVGAYLYSLTDRYPPFSLQPDPSYPIDIVVERPPQSSKLYALFTLIVEVVVIAAAIWATVWFFNNFETGEWGTGASTDDPFAGFGINLASSGPSVLILRNIAALPHLIILGVLGLVTFVIWIIVQWIILFTAKYPRGLFDLVVGVTRWQTRVTAYTLGLNDHYPPFSFDPSLTAPAPGPGGWTPPAGAGWTPAAGGAWTPPLGPPPGGSAPPPSQPPAASPPASNVPPSQPPPSQPPPPLSAPPSNAPPSSVPPPPLSPPAAPPGES